MNVEKQTINNAVRECQRAINVLEEVSLKDKRAGKGKGLDFSSQRMNTLLSSIKQSIDVLEKLCSKTALVSNKNNELQTVLNELREHPSIKNLQKAVRILPDDTSQNTVDSTTTDVASMHFDLSHIPQQVRAEIGTDVAEAQKCFATGCYRSSVILCGRILETALHRKHFELTGNDLLEKAPGIGLGSVIARLTEKGAMLDPGLSNQIHLVNQVRVWSVHTKQEPFTPSRTQAHAILLYTLDAVQKLFGK